MNYLFAPLSRQADKGFGLTADAFKEAAQMLYSDKTQSLNTQIPICYLFRHSIELYLKSAIVVFFTRFSLINEDGSKEEPRIKKKDKLLSIYAVHDIEVLYKHWKHLLANQEKFLKENTNTNWHIPPEMDALVTAVDELDQRGTFFRYPISGIPQRDETKFQFKTTNVTELSERAEKGENLKVTLFEDANGNLIHISAFDSNVLSDDLKKLADLADFLSSVHVAIRFEICGGN